MIIPLTRRTSRLLATAAVAIGSLVPLSLMTAGPASAVDNGCVDYAIAQPTAVHGAPNDTSPTIKFKNSGDRVTGTCYYYNNGAESRYYMQVFTSQGVWGYIWVQRLSYGSTHTCDDNGYTHGIGSSSCPLLQA